MHNELDGKPVPGTDGLAYYYYPPDPLRERIRHEPVSVRDLTAYATGIFYERHGVGSDFTTSPELFPQMGACYARFADRVHERLGRPVRFPVFEAGGGNGTFVQSFLAEASRLRHLRDSIEYHMIEQSAGLVSWQQQRVAGMALASRVHWHNQDATTFLFPSLDAAMYIVTENDDDIPNHAVRNRNGQPTEVFLVDGEEDPVDVERAAGYEVQRLIHRYPRWWTLFPKDLRHPLPVHADSVRIRERFVNSVKRGVMVTTDYGHDLAVTSWPELNWRFHPYRIYHNSKVLSLPNGKFSGVFALIGEANVTADVDFRLLAQPAEQAGWSTEMSENRIMLDALGIRQIVQERVRELAQAGDRNKLWNYAWRLAPMIDIPTDWVTMVQWKGFEMDVPSVGNGLQDWFTLLLREYGLENVRPPTRPLP